MSTYPLDQIPFSLRGSYLLVTSRNSSGSPRLLYKTCSSRLHNLHDIPFPADEFFELALVKDGLEVPYTWHAYPHRLDLNGEDGEKVSLAFSDKNTIVFEARNAGLKLMPSKVFPIQYSPVAHEIYLIDWFARGIHMFRVDDHSTLQATITPIVTGIEKHWGEFPCTITYLPKDDTPVFHGAIRFSRYETFWDEPIPDFETIISRRQKEVDKWMRKLPPVPEMYHLPAEAAWFLLWDCQVSPEKFLTRQAIYMSKFWMNGIWAWDNLFNAIAIAGADPQLAWDQLLLFFDHQDPNGMVPDMISDLATIYGFTKPPLQGWAIRKMVQRQGVEKAFPYLNRIYKPLSQLTDWWYIYRDFDKDGLPQYFHGNDSGWDNATVFDMGLPVEGADLCAYLVLQCECLAFIAQAIGRKKAAGRWKSRADAQLAALLSHSVKDDHFFSPITGTHEVEPSQSLINYMPLILGKRLPKPIRQALIRDLQPGGPYLTQYGLASEPPSSIKYMPDGYWRGPIWAGSTYIIFDGLLACGENDLARLVAERFCNLCLQVPGFWENYDALSGQGLRCPGYTWTASIFLLLAEWLERNPRSL
jgi:putative isomerase